MCACSVYVNFFRAAKGGGGSGEGGGLHNSLNCDIIGILHLGQSGRSCCRFVELFGFFSPNENTPFASVAFSLADILKCSRLALAFLVTCLL